MKNALTRLQIWWCRLIAGALISMPLIALEIGPRSGDNFTNLWRLGLVFVVCVPLAVVVANFSNTVSRDYLNR